MHLIKSECLDNTAAFDKSPTSLMLAAAIESNVHETLTPSIPAETISTSFSQGHADPSELQSAIREMTISSPTKATSDTLPSIITLDVGGRKFKTLLSTLMSESGYFQALFSGRWTCTPEKDGSYFVDANPDTFEHLLQYMRRPGIFPLFWSKTSGFDYGMYQRLGHEARFFQIDELGDWIERQGYLDGIAVQVDLPQEQSISQATPKTIKGNEEISHNFFLKTRRVYICPRGIFVHRGDPDRCGAGCRKTQAGTEVEYEQEYYVDFIPTTKSFQFNQKAYENVG